jgi:hypothetical protein
MKAAPFQAVVRLTFGEETFDVVKLMASEVAKIRTWTSLASKRAWVEALGAEDIDAFRAGYTLMKQRAGEDIRFSDADFDTDEMSVTMIDGANGREVEPNLVLDEDGDPVLDAKDRPQFVQVDGVDSWLYSDDGSAVPPTEA